MPPTAIIKRKQESFCGDEKWCRRRVFDNETPIYIISLQRKREKCFDLLKSLKIPQMITIVNAVDGQDIEYKPNGTAPFLRRGEIGCFASHIMIMKHMVDHDVKWALILEEDARMALPEELAKMNEYLEKTPEDWELLTFTDGSNKSAVEKINDKIIVPDKWLWNTHVYLLTLQGATKLLERFKETGFSAPYDEWLYSSDIKIYSSVDAPFNRVDLGSETRNIE